MKTLLTLIFAVLLTVSVSAQYPFAPKVTLNCDSTLTIEQLSAGGDCYSVLVSKGNTTVEQTRIPVTLGANLIYTTSYSISPSASQYSVDVVNITGGCLSSNTVGVGGGYSTSIVWTVYNANGSATGAPALLGYTYQYGTTAVQTATCPVQSAATFIKKKGKGRGNGN
jgi:hypothetical protein